METVKWHLDVPVFTVTCQFQQAIKILCIGKNARALRWQTGKDVNDIIEGIPVSSNPSGQPFRHDPRRFASPNPKNLLDADQKQFFRVK
tara:strand:- start:10840 stop:11106 length:267 start_codon:yes stop_codon:yes gene_type:complete